MTILQSKKKMTNLFAPSTLQKHLQPSNIRELEKALVWPNILHFFKIWPQHFSRFHTPNGHTGWTKWRHLQQTQPIHPTHDTIYVHVLAPPASAGPIALFLIVQIPELVAILHETRRVLPSNKNQANTLGKIWGNTTPYHPVQLRNEGHKKSIWRR